MHTAHQKSVVAVISIGCLCAVLLLGLWLRVQGVAFLPVGQFTETDAYLYYQQAAMIAETGHLPARDMTRWVPLGRDLGQTLNLYPYVLAYTYKAMAWAIPGLTLYHVVVYAPAFCFSLALAGFSLFLYWTHGARVALSAAVIVATLPATIERSAAGFGDRDAWCLLLGLLSVVTYLTAGRSTDARHRLLWTVVSGVVMFCGGLSWEGFVGFSVCILGVELWKFLTTDAEEGLGYYLLWVCLFVPLLYFASPAYRQGTGFATHLRAVLLVPPVVVLVLRSLRHGLLCYSPWRDGLSPHARKLAGGLTLSALAVALVTLRGTWQTFEVTTVPFSNSALMQSVGELQPPHSGYWIFRYGSVYLIGSLGLAAAVLQTWGKPARTLALGLLAFAALVFFRQPLDTLWGGTVFGNALFAIVTLACGFALLRLAGKQPPHDTMLAMLIWALVWMALSRDAKRYDFFIGIPLAYFTADLVRAGSEWLCNVFHNPAYTTEHARQKVPYTPLNIALTTGALLLALLWGPREGGHLLRAHFAATQFRTPIPGNSELATAFHWMRQHLSSDAVVAAEWSFGTQLNVLAGVKTITGPDHYLPYWIQMYDDAVRFTDNETEALAFLKTHGATHILITGKQPPHGILRQTLSDAFVPRYPQEGFEEAVVKLWQLRYPPHLQPQPKYLETAPATDTGEPL